LIGETLSHYRVVEKLGAGGMGEVYRAEDTVLGRDVALKVLPETFTRDAERLARLEREARVLATLDHPNIAAIYSFEEERDVHFLVMQLAEGETLETRIARGPIPLEEALAIAGQIAQALASAHERGIIHRDLKPGNVKVDAVGHVPTLDVAWRCRSRRR
jgi:serine/threonine protein kinase